MNEMFSQGGKGSTGILTNKQAIARAYNIKVSEVIYSNDLITTLDNKKALYDKSAQYVWAVPTGLPIGATIVSVTGSTLVYNPGNVSVTLIDMPDLATQLKEDLANIDGESLVGKSTYAQIRSYDGNGTVIECLGRSTIFDGAYGTFALSSDTTSADDDGTILVDALSRRWKRVITDSIYPEWWGAVADNTTDCSAALQKALDFASGKNRTGVKTGYKLRLRGGRYVFNTGLQYTWRNTTGVVDDGDMRRLSIEGDGTGNTYLIYGGPSTTPAITIQGGSGGGVYLRMHLSDFRLWRSLSLTRYLGVGISIQRGAVWTLERVDIGIFNTGLNLEDTLYGTAYNCDFSGNNQGLSAKLTSYSSPNSLTFQRCMFGGCLVRGAYIINGANVNFDSCTFEGIGTDGTNEAILYQGGQHEGGMGLYLRNCYFENNYTLYDVNISNGTTYPGTHKIDGCSFNRPSLARATVGGSINLYSSTAVEKVTISSCAFKGFNDYTASSARPAYTVQSATVSVVDSGNYYMYDVERPNVNNFPVVGNGLGQIAATARIASEGTVTLGWNIASVSKTGTGAYTITLTKPILSAGIGIVNISNGVGTGTVTVTNTTTIQVQTYNSAFVPADLSFNLVYFGNIV